MSLSYPKRLIEVDLPIKRISAHARREKSIRHGHISTLHIWWARRPLAACRAVICASLWPDPADPLCPQAFRDAAAEHITAFAHKASTNESLSNGCSKESLGRWLALGKPEGKIDPANSAHLNLLRYALLDFIADFANWDNSTVPGYLETARALTQTAHEALGGAPGTRPLVVDPFAGGGAIPLEALRVGADAFASDLNPVAVLLNKVVLEYIPKYGQHLADEVRKWGAWVKEQAEKELAEFYPKDPDGATPIAYLWARTIICEGPGCGAEVPLMRSLWISKTGKRSVAFRIKTDKKGKNIDIEIMDAVKSSEIGHGTSAGGAATCPICGYTTSVESVRSQLTLKRGGASSARLTAVVFTKAGKSGQFYRLPSLEDRKAALAAQIELQHRIDIHHGDQELVPDGSINHIRGYFNVVLYGNLKWGDLFSPRQLLALTTYARLIQEIPNHAADKKSHNLTEAVLTCLSLIVDRVAVRCTANCIWDATTGCIMQIFNQGQSLPARWEFAEMNPSIDSGSGWHTSLEYTLKVIEHCSCITNVGHVEHASATKHPLPDDVAQAVITDPPYYAAVPYADLSDFFYSWLKRSLGQRHKDLFQSELTPKADEIVSLAHRAAMYREKDGHWFEQQMQIAGSEAHRICSPLGIGLFVFANKETEAWEAMVAALLEAGWVITASWPIDTESGNRLRAKESAALASSIHLVCRPRENPDGSLRANNIGDWRDVLIELPKRIHEWMSRLAAEGVVGADAIFACLGPALEVFSRYSRVEKSNGEQVTLSEYLVQVWAAVSREALNMIFKDSDVTGFEEDARLTAMWLWTLSTNPDTDASVSVDEDTASDDDDEASAKTIKPGGYVLEYDAARKIAQGLGAHLEQLKSLIEVKGNKARLLPVRERLAYLVGSPSAAPVPVGRKSKKAAQPRLFEAVAVDIETTQAEWGELDVPEAGITSLDRVHQSMLLFNAGRGEALKRFLVENGAGNDQRFWKLAQALSALYPAGSDEKRWVDGVLARKKGLGF